MFLTAREVANRLSCTMRWIHILCARGELQHIRIGKRGLRIHEDAIAAFIASRTK